MNFFSLSLLCLSFVVFAQSSPEDGDWKSPLQIKNNTSEAEYMIRVGDIDNVSFGWPEDFDPFSGNSTYSHGYPWEVNSQDPDGTDRIIVPSGFTYDREGCGAVDGYTSNTNRSTNTPRAITIPLKGLSGKEIKKATIQIFIDDFQSPSIGSKFKVWLNGSFRFIEMERLLRGIDQTGPVGKLITVNLPGNFLNQLNKESLTLFIDDSLNCVGDGFAIDFVKLLINPKNLIRTGIPRVIVKAEDSDQPISGAMVTMVNGPTGTTDAQGSVSFASVAAGMHVFEVTAQGYKSVRKSGDVLYKSEEAIIILLPKAQPIDFDGNEVKAGTKLVLKNIQFQQAKSELQSTGKQELLKVATLMKENPLLEIELSGHTSNEGERSANIELSRLRSESCKRFLMEQGIEEERIKAIGYGPDQPAFPNTSDLNKSKNRRVELNILKL